MHFLLIFSLAFNVVASAGIVYYSFRIASMYVTPKWTWSLKGIAWSIQLAQIGVSVFYVNSIEAFTTMYPPTTLVVSYGLSAIRLALLFIFVTRIYYTLRSKFPPTTKV